MKKEKEELEKKFKEKHGNEAEDDCYSSCCNAPMSSWIKYCSKCEEQSEINEGMLMWHPQIKPYEKEA